MKPIDRQQPASVVEWVAVFFALCAVAIVQITGSRCLELFYHPLWLDETFTSRLTNDPSFSHMLAAVTGGMDTNPPTLYLILWPIAWLFGPIGNTGLRVFSVVWMLVGMTGLYAICRRYFGRGPSTVAVLAIWAHPLIIDQAFESRFYAPWFALTVWFCYLQMDTDADEPASKRVARYLLGILATSIHYFGVISMGMIAATDLLIYRRVKRVIPAIIGVAVVVCCLPIMRGQRAGLSIATWIDPIGPSEIKDAFVAVFGAPSILMVLLVMWIARLLGGTETAEDQSHRNFRTLIPFSSLLVFPLAIVAFSILVQPALVLRYLILAIAPLAPMLAALVERSGRRAIAAALLGLIAMGGVTIIGKSRATRGLDHEYMTAIVAIDQRVPPDGTIIFKRRREMYPVLHIRPDLAKRSAQLDFADSLLPNATRMSRFERDMGRKVQRLYPDLRMANVEELRNIGTFYVVAPLDEYKELQLQLPGFNVADPESMLHEVTVQK